MTLDSEEQRTMILNALLTVPIQADYAGMCESLPKMHATIEAVKAATIEVQEDGNHE